MHAERKEEENRYVSVVYNKQHFLSLCSKGAGLDIGRFHGIVALPSYDLLTLPYT